MNCPVMTEDFNVNVLPWYHYWIYLLPAQKDLWRVAQMGWLIQ